MALNQGPAVVVGAVAVTVAIVLLKLQHAADTGWVCGGGMYYDPWKRECVPPPECPMGTSYNPCSRTCEVPPQPLGPPIPTCDPGGQWDPCFQQCVTGTPCPPPSPWLYDPNIRLCLPPGTPAGLQVPEGSLVPEGFRPLV